MLRLGTNHGHNILKGLVLFSNSFPKLVRISTMQMCLWFKFICSSYHKQKKKYSNRITDFGGRNFKFNPQPALGSIKLKRTSEADYSLPNKELSSKMRQLSVKNGKSRLVSKQCNSPCNAATEQTSISNCYLAHFPWEKYNKLLSKLVSFRALEIQRKFWKGFMSTFYKDLRLCSHVIAGWTLENALKLSTQFNTLCEIDF